MSAEKRPWTEAERSIAIESNSARGMQFLRDNPKALPIDFLYEDQIRLQCEHTALYEALTYMMETRDPQCLHDSEQDNFCAVCKARAALSAAMPQKEGTR